MRDDNLKEWTVPCAMKDVSKNEALKDLDYAITLCKEQEAKNKGVILRHAYIDLLPNVKRHIVQSRLMPDINMNRHIMFEGTYEELLAFLKEVE